MIKCLKKITNGKLIIKKHPHTPDGIYTNVIEYPYSYLPYEIIAANDNDMQDKVLITRTSTSVWTPMLLFNKFPKIILLYPLFNKMLAKDIIEKLISLYDKDKVLVVNSFEELETLKLDRKQGG